MEKINICDETLIFQYDVEIKWQSMHWKTPASAVMKKSKDVKSKFKTILIVFCDINGTVMTEWVTEGQIINQTYSLPILATLREQVRKKTPGLWKNNLWILYQDNTPVHNALFVKHYLAAIGTPVLEHAPYSPE